MCQRWNNNKQTLRRREREIIVRISTTNNINAMLFCIWSYLFIYVCVCVLFLNCWLCECEPRGIRGKKSNLGMYIYLSIYLNILEISLIYSNRYRYTLSIYHSQANPARPFRACLFMRCCNWYIILYVVHKDICEFQSVLFVEFRFKNEQHSTCLTTSCRRTFNFVVYKNTMRLFILFCARYLLSYFRIANNRAEWTLHTIYNS